MRNTETWNTMMDQQHQDHQNKLVEKTICVQCHYKKVTLLNWVENTFEQ